MRYSRRPLSVAFVSLVCVTMLGGVPQRSMAEETAITQPELVRRAQELFDAVIGGDQAPWKKYYADDCLYHDEKGHAFDKAGVLGDVSPFPKGYSGSIKVVNPKSIITHNCAILNYDLDETETIFGQELHARYHQTDTWLLRSGTWQIAATEVMRYYEDPALGHSDPALFAAYIGTYQLSKDSDRKTVVSVADGQLTMERTTGAKTTLFPEVPDLFFRKGVEGRILFHLGDNGKSDALIDRRNNEDVIWKRIS